MTLEELYWFSKANAYGEMPYNPEHKPLISFLICCRVYGTEEFRLIDRINNDLTEYFNLYTLFKSYVGTHGGKNLQEAEFIIKFDTDNTLALEEYLLRDGINKNFPGLIVRPIIYNRWESKNALYLNYAYLFSKKNPASKFVGFLTDDSIIYTKILDQIEAFKNEKYAILTSHGKSFPDNEGNTILPFVANEGLIDYIYNWKQDNFKWREGWISEPYPIVTSKLVETIGNMGWQMHIDSTFTLLTVILKCKYGIDLRRFINPWCMRGNKGVNDTYESKFNNEYCISRNLVPPDDIYIWKLYEQMAHNIYLNLKSEEN